MRRRIHHAIRSVWISVGVALLVLVSLEGAARVGIALYERRRPTTDEAVFDVRLGADDPAGPDWAKEYFREFADARQSEWHPYVYWRRRPYRGGYINIDKAGIRRTWNSTSAPSPNQLRVFMFGGSTVWGYGVRDEFTIPSLVSKRLTNHLATGVWVTNFGEWGYVSTQDVIALVLELQRGNMPDIVVFYGGINDTWAAFQSGVAGIPQNENNRVTEFNSRRRINWREGFVNRLALYGLSRWAVGSIHGSRAGSYSGEGTTQTEALAGAVVDRYLQNVRIVDSLASRFGFRAVFCWQPTVFSKKHLSQREKRGLELSKGRYGRAAPFIDEVHRVFRERMSRDKIDNVFDLSGVFDETVGTVFLDLFHVSEAGNDTVAEAISRILRSVARTRN